MKKVNPIIALPVSACAMFLASNGLAEDKTAMDVMAQAQNVADNEHAYLRSILVVKDSEIISERYFHGANSSQTQNMKSLTKSFMSALIGIAIKKGFIESVDQTVASILPEYFEEMDLPENYYDEFLADREKVQEYQKKLTIRHLLTMTSGLHSFQNSFRYGYGHVGDIAEAYLGLPFSAPPGDRFQYTTAGAHVLSHVISRATKMPTRKFAEKFLFDPLHIEYADWKVGPKGHALGGSGLYLTAGDLAKFGQLYLDDGLIGDKRIFPEEWTAASLAEQTQVAPPAFISYGYLWWRRAGNPAAEDYFFAAGTGGQFIFLMPEHNLAVVITADPEVSAEDFNTRNEALKGFAEQYLLYPLAAVGGA